MKQDSKRHHVIKHAGLSRNCKRGTKSRANAHDRQGARKQISKEIE